MRNWLSHINFLPLGLNRTARTLAMAISLVEHARVVINVHVPIVPYSLPYCNIGFAGPPEKLVSKLFDSVAIGGRDRNCGKLQRYHVHSVQYPYD